MSPEMVYTVLFFVCLGVSGFNQVCTVNFPTNITVAQDGTGNFKNIEEAIKAASSNSLQRFYIKIKAGIYREYLFIGPEKTRITLVGDGMGRTRIIGNKSIGAGFRTQTTATVSIEGHLTVAIDISFENEAGPMNHEAVALSSVADSAFYRCSFLGYQDTLFTGSGRQFYKECHVYGTIDFIYGNAIAVFQNCHIFVRKPLQNQYNVITAQGRQDRNGPQGVIIHRSRITASPEFEHMPLVRTYLGRPWKTFSRVVIMLCYLDKIIHPEGWIVWDEHTQRDMLFFAEYGNEGPGGITSGRVHWPGFKIFNNSKEANPFTVRNFIGGLEWLPLTQVPFLLDL